MLRTPSLADLRPLMLNVEWEEELGAKRRDPREGEHAYEK
jgi:hypothetical protein